MSLATTISQYAATNPAVAAAVTAQSTESAILSGMESGDTADSGLLGALYSQATEAETLLNSANPVSTSTTSAGSNQSASTAIGGNVDVAA